jgi:hypothetical protein
MTVPLMIALLADGEAISLPKILLEQGDRPVSW